MKIDPKDRRQLLRMAGNIAGGMVSQDTNDAEYLAEDVAKIAILTLEAVDKEIAERNKDAGLV